MSAPGGNWIRTRCAATRRILKGGRWSRPAALMAVVKADAYGHGAVRVARILQRGRCAVLCRGLSCRGASPCAGRGIRGDILILGWTRPRAGRRFSPRWRLTQTVVSAEHGRELARQGIPDSGPSGTGYRHAPDWHPCGGTAAAPGRIVAPWRAAGDRGSFSHLCVSDDLSGESCAFHPTAGPPDSAMPLTG